MKNLCDYDINDIERRILEYYAGTPSFIEMVKRNGVWIQKRRKTDEQINAMWTTIYIFDDCGPEPPEDRLRRIINMTPVTR
jgi:hypothetical protein